MRKTPALPLVVEEDELEELGRAQPKEACVWLLGLGCEDQVASSSSTPSVPPTCGGLVGNIVVLVDGLRRLVLGLSDHGGHGGGVDVGEDAASHSLQQGRSLIERVASPRLEVPPRTFTTPAASPCTQRRRSSLVTDTSRLILGFLLLCDPTRWVLGPTSCDYGSGQWGWVFALALKAGKVAVVLCTGRCNLCRLEVLVSSENFCLGIWKDCLHTRSWCARGSGGHHPWLEVTSD